MGTSTREIASIVRTPFDLLFTFLIFDAFEIFFEFGQRGGSQYKLAFVLILVSLRLGWVPLLGLATWRGIGESFLLAFDRAFSNQTIIPILAIGFGESEKETERNATLTIVYFWTRLRLISLEQILIVGRFSYAWMIILALGIFSLLKALSLEDDL